MSTQETIILNGIGEMDRGTERLIKKVCKVHNVRIYPTYYDWSLEGTRNNIEKVTQEMWGMPEDEWSENGFSVEPII